MQNTKNNARTSNCYSYAYYATDATFQQFNSAPGSMAEGKTEFSGKHELYENKLEIFALLLGLCVECTTHSSGSVSDLELFRKNFDFHAEASKNVVGDLDIFDDGLLEEMSSDF